MENYPSLIKNKDNYQIASDIGYVHIKNLLVNILKPEDREAFTVAGTRGQGGNLPFINYVIIKSNSYSSPTSPSSGKYVDYLLNQYGDYIYLTFCIAAGITEKNTPTKSDRLNLRKTTDIIINKLPAELLAGFETDSSKMDLGDKPAAKIKSYKNSTICFKEYKKSNLPDEEELEQDFQKIMDIYKYYLEYLKPEIENEDYSPQEAKDSSMENIITVRQEEKTSSYDAECKHDGLNPRSFSSYLSSKGICYSPTLTTNFIAALRAKPFVLLAGISGTGKTQLARKFAEYIGATERNGHYLQVPVRPDWSDSTDLFGHKTLNDGFVKGPILDFIIQANSDKKHPYILCLDEMNLARVEYYFSDFLSVIETRERDNGEITSAPLIPDLYASYKSAQKNFYASDLNIPDNIYLSDNIYIIGTVNMDESTFPFSKKVLDRAMTIEFSNVELDKNLFGIDSKSNPSTINVHNDDLKARYIAPLEIEDGNRKLAQKIADELAEYNDLLEEAHLHVGYRVRNEIIYYSIYAREMDPSFDYMDYALMQKVLPRIQGSSNNIRNVLLNIYNKARGTSFDADDRVFEKIDADIKNTGNTKMLQTAEKIRYMLKRLQEDGYTAYWL